MVNELHIPVNDKVILRIQSADVLHSFLPSVHIKQDMVPGAATYLVPNQRQAYLILCAELCGWGHYKMRGRLIVESEDDFNEWYASAVQEQNRTSLNAASDK